MSDFRIEHDTMGEVRVPADARGDWRVPVVWWVSALALGALFTGAALAGTASSMRTCAVPILCND